MRGVRHCLLLALAGVACRDHHPTAPEAARGQKAIVSNVVRLHADSTSGAVATASENQELAYVSLAEGTVPEGVTAVVHSAASEFLITTSVIDGGFDPVALPAKVGDIIDVSVRDSKGAAVFTAQVTVALRRPPAIVRTFPPRGKKDVALNARIGIVFSEPISAANLASAVRLRTLGQTVPGTVRLVPGSAVIAEFVPHGLLAPGTTYVLEITSEIRDLDGDPLEAGGTVEFTTGSSLTGPPVKITPFLDTIFVAIGARYQLEATVLDAAGNVLDIPVTWSSSDSTGVAVSPAGRITALADGDYQIIGRVDSVRKFAGVYVNPAPATTIEMTPAKAVIAQWDTLSLTVQARDTLGRVIRHPAITLGSSPPGIVRIEGSRVIALAQGEAVIQASGGHAIASTTLTIGPPVPVGSVVLTPHSTSAIIQGTVSIRAELQDATGRVIGNRSIVWKSADQAIATVTGDGFVTAVAQGRTVISATSEGVVGSTTVEVTTLRLSSISVGAEDDLDYAPNDFQGHVCGLSTDGIAFCWGHNTAGELGDGTLVDREIPTGVSDSHRFVSIGAGFATTCGLTTDGTAYCWGSGTPRPEAQMGGRRFVALTVGGYHVCGLTSDGSVYCWGDDEYGQLGDAWPIGSGVAGGLHFTSVTAGGFHTCGLTGDGAAYCWGNDDAGQLGGSTLAPVSCYESHCSAVPLPVTGGLKFASIAAGAWQTCALTASGDAYCWPFSASTEPGPRLVPGGVHFVGLSVGQYAAYGLTAAGELYGWDVHDDRPGAARFAGNRTFTSVSAGLGACGISTDGVTFCLGGGDTLVKVPGQP